MDAARRTLARVALALQLALAGTVGHADEARGIVFQGDLFYYDASGPFPPSGRGTMNGFFARWLGEHGLKPRAVYGVHSDPAGPELLALAAR